MSKRRTHSTIDKLPAALRKAILTMLIDSIWPADFTGDRLTGGKPLYEDIVSYCRQKGHSVSMSAIGRWAIRMRSLSRMKQAGVITREVMADLTDEKASQNQKAVAEMLTAICIEFVGSQENFEAKEIRDMAKAIKDCTAVAIASDKHVRDQIAKKVKKTAATTQKKLTAAGVDRKLIQEIMDEHLGVTKS